MLGEEIFRSGTLHMSGSALDTLAGTPAWSDLAVNRVLVVVSVILLVANLPDLFRLVPQLLFCFNRSRGAEALEHSLGMARMRNTTALFFALPFCLIADRYELLRPALWSVVPRGWSALATVGALGVFLLLRALCYALMRPRRLGGEAFAALRHNLYNYLLLLAPLMLVTVAVVISGRLDDALARTLLLAETGAVWLFSLLRSGQILGAHCSGLSTFLYLCGLELLPVALMVAAVVLF